MRFGWDQTVSIPCRHFSLSTLALHNYERQNDVVQHPHPRWLDFESRLPLLYEVACMVELSNNRLLLISSDQLHTVVQRRGHRVEVGNKRTLGKFSPIAPSAHLY